MISREDIQQCLISKVEIMKESASQTNEKIDPEEFRRKLREASEKVSGKNMRVQDLKDKVRYLESRNATLLAACKKLLESNELYADEKSWIQREDPLNLCIYKMEIINTDAERSCLWDDSGKSKLLTIGGKRAREARSDESVKKVIEMIGKK